MDQLVRGNEWSAQRRPISMMATRYPFSASRSAETLPPNPEPITMKSKSNFWSRWRRVAMQSYLVTRTALLALCHHVLSRLDDFLCNRAAQCDRVERLVLAQPAQDRQLGPQHVAIGARCNDHF